MFLAVRLEVPLGDFAALNSVNVVFAAFLARIFLREPLHLSNYLAMASSIAGAVCISQPEMLFGHSDRDSGASWVAHVLSLLSGFCDACVYVTTRRCSDTAPTYITLSFTTQASIMLLATAPAVDGLPVARLATSPLETSGWVFAIFAVTTVSLIAFAGAAQWCPAAVSATVDTGTRMVVGYAMQVLLFDAALELISVLGAAMMLTSVVSMTLMQSFAGQDPDGSVSAAAETSAGDTNNDSANTVALPNDISSVRSGDDSLASFVALEFCCSTLRHRPPLRLRRLMHQGRCSAPTARAVGASVVGLETVLA